MRMNGHVANNSCESGHWTMASSDTNPDDTLDEEEQVI